MTQPSAPAIVFTDLDGTLLDHETYCFDPARPALTFLRERGIPVILASSKTAAEIADLRDRIGFAECPAIVENGAGILEPGEAPDDMAPVHADLLSRLSTVSETLRRHFSGFSDWTVPELVARTGLSPEAAEKAAQRRFTEPGVWSGTAAERASFEVALAERGVAARFGGRYLTLSFGATKADRMREITMRYATPDCRPFVIALGDAPNDVEMLEAADHGVLVANPHGVAIPTFGGERNGRVVRTEKPGPTGWNDAIQRLIEEKRMNGELKADG
ncbi:HAD-IIB family hydrolase [Oricola sp.]|uniref:HAD-IIB family hydrolase n=1 Tax=Oricola sp. TaxID=1979950 RepID=UPI003BAADF26